MLSRARYEGAPTRAQRKAERGATLVEYVILVALVAVVAAGALAYLGRAATTTLDDLAAEVAGATLQIFVPSAGTSGANMCPADPCRLTIDLSHAGSSTVVFEVRGAQPGYQFDYPNGFSGSLTFVGGAGTPLEMEVWASPGGPVPISATDSTGASGYLTVELTVT